jgi:hypothetical protein
LIKTRFLNELCDDELCDDEICDERTLRRALQHGLML